MAGVSTDAKGNRKIQFTGRDRKRRILYLGSVPMKIAQTISLRIENLVTASVLGVEPDRATLDWVQEIGDDLARKLAKFELIPERKPSALPENRKLNQFITAYIASRGETKRDTRTQWGQSQRDLIAFFGADRDIASITKPEAMAFRAYLVNEKGVGGETVKKRIGNARMFFRSAVEQELIPSNPFLAVSAGTSGLRKRPKQQFVPQDVVEAVLPYCTPVVRLMAILARYGGMRCPSEPGSLRWQDIDFDRGQILIPVPKLEHHDGKDTRLCPLFPRVRQELEKLRQESSDDAEYLLESVRTKWMTQRGWRAVNVRTVLMKAIKKAGYRPWPKLFNSLRGSCETELLAQGIPAHVVADWLGHSVQIQRESYARVRPEDFERVTGIDPTRIPTRTTPAPAGRGQTTNEGFPANPSLPDLNPDKSRGLDKSGISPGGMETSAESQWFSGCVPDGDSPDDSEQELQDLMSSWPYLSGPARHEILGIAYNALESLRKSR